MEDLALGAVGMTPMPRALRRRGSRGPGGRPDRAAGDDPDLGLAGKGGPLVAICGVCGGAGASTLTALLATVAQREAAALPEPADVLACDAGNGTGGLALYTGTTSARSLAQVAASLEAGEPPIGPPFAVTPGGLRVIATGPASPAEPHDEAVARVLTDARAAHALTVVDCGTLERRPERVAVTLASHVLWLLPATESGAERARRFLAQVAVGDGAVEAVVARHDAAGRRPAMGDLAALAQERRAPLVLMPHVPDLAASSIDEAVVRAQVTLQALATTLRGRPA